MIVRRFDNGIVVSMEKTPEGFLKGIARVTRTGVFTYRNADGTLRRELRHPDEVFSRASLESMRMIPITNLHPAEKLVTADTAKQLSIGMTGENVIPDGKFVMVPIAITTRDGVIAIENGREELSLGYETELEETPGSYDGEEYDFVQRKIGYNHLAIVDRGRAGADVRLNMDEMDAVEVPKEEEEEEELGEDGLPIKKKDGGPGSGPQGGSTKGAQDPRSLAQAMNTENQRRNAALGITKGSRHFPSASALAAKAAQHSNRGYTPRDKKDSVDGSTNNQHSTRSDSMVKVRLDNGLEYDAAPEVVVAFAALQTKLDGLSTENKTLLASADKLRADGDTAKETNVQLQKKIDAVPAAVETAVKARVSLVKVATDTLDAETVTKLDTLSNTEIKKAIILSRFPEAKLDNASADYIQARFDAAIEIKTDDSSAAAQRSAAIPRNDGKTTTSAEARRDEMIKNMKERSTK